MRPEPHPAKATLSPLRTPGPSWSCMLGISKKVDLSPSENFSWIVSLHHVLLNFNNHVSSGPANSSLPPAHDHTFCLTSVVMLQRKPGNEDLVPCPRPWIPRLLEMRGTLEMKQCPALILQAGKLRPREEMTSTELQDECFQDSLAFWT